MKYTYSTPLITEKWDAVLDGEFHKPYFAKLLADVQKAYAEDVVYPPFEHIFRAMKIVDFDSIRVVILGQDPYHGENQANGLAFAVNNGVDFPPSLKNIFTEIKNDIGFFPQNDSSLLGWAKQGVLLLNTALTVPRACPMAHANLGWHIFTDAVIAALNRSVSPVAYILWGNPAKAKLPLIVERHFIITSAHPSPLSCHRGFFGSAPFSKVNNFLISAGLKPIDWLDTSGVGIEDYYLGKGKIVRVP